MPLDAREVEAKGRDLLKANSTPNSSPTLLRILSDLRSGVVASEELLRSTKIGVQVNRLRQNSDKAVARQATELVTKWRQDVGKGRGGPNVSNGGGSGANTPRPGSVATSSAANGGASPAPRTQSPAGKKGKWAAADKTKRNAKEDGIKWQVTGNQTRDSCVKLMYDGLAFMSEEFPEDILRVAHSVEVAAFNAYQPETSDVYRNKIRSLFQNLKNKNNQALRDRVFNGEIPPARFVKMTHEELKSAERKAEDLKMMKENMDKAMVAQEEKSVSTALWCGKCGQNKVSYTQAQTRSADEPMTTFCECLNCGNRWKFS